MEIVLITFFCVFAFQAGFFYVSGVDIGFHIRAGELLWTTGNIPEINTFSSYCPDDPWLIHQWLPATLIYLLWSKLGLTGLIVGKAVFGALIFLAIFMLAKSEAIGRNRTFLALWATTLAVLLARPRLLERPYLFSALLFVLILHADRKYYSSKTWHTLGIPLVMALWSNIHTGVILGFQLLFILRAAKWIEWLLSLRKAGSTGVIRQSPPIWQTAALFFAMGISALAVSLINPNGISVLTAPLLFFLDPYGKAAISELAPVTGGLKVLIIATLSVITVLILINRRRIDIGLLLLSVFFGFFALTTQRTILFFSIVAAAQLAHLLSVTFTDWNAKHTWACHAMALPVLWVSTTLFYFMPDPTFAYGIGLNKRYYPIDIFKFMLSEIPSQNFYNDAVYGGPMLWFTFPEFRPFVDGRGDAYSMDFWKYTYDPVSSGVKSLEFFDANGLTGALVWNPHGTSRPLTSELLKAREWHLIACNDFTLLFLRDTAANRTSIQKYDITQFDPTTASLPFAEDALPRAAAEASKSLLVSPTSIYWKTAAAKTMLLAGNYAEAEPLYQELMMLEGSSYAYRRDHAYCIYMLGNTEEAAAAFLELTQHPQQDGYPWYMLALIARNANKPEDATRAIKKAISSDTNNSLYTAFAESLRSNP